MFSLASILSHSGPVGILVMGLLVVFSIISWAIIFAKWQRLIAMQKHNGNFIELFWRTKDLHQLIEQEQCTTSPSGHVFRDGIGEYERQLAKGKDKIQTFLVVERALARSGRKQLKQAESNLPWLATIGAISPFIGLFGTVVGIMSSFQQIGQAGNANLSTVAPGIAEALLATALGLFAAIPAVMAYNVFQTKIRQLKGDLENFCLDLLVILKSQN